MKNIIVNLKRFDISKEKGGVYDGYDSASYARNILEDALDSIKKYSDIEFTFFFQESHLLNACKLAKGVNNCQIGCQSVHEFDVEKGGNFGAFTSLRTAKAMKQLGCNSVLVGHCEERKYLNYLYGLVDVNNQIVINEILNRKMKQAQSQGMQIVYCIGEEYDQLDNWDKVLTQQLEIGLKNINPKEVIIGYEPLWSIGPGKTPASKEYIEKVVKLIKSFNSNLRVIYGGGVKQDNAEMLASIKELDGGLIGLTNFKDNIGFHAKEFVEIVDIYQKRLEKQVQNET